MTPEDGAARPGVSARLEALTEAVAELHAGQDELLRLYEELGELYPKNCLCAGMRDRARAEALAVDVFTNDTIEGEPEVWQQ